MFGSFCVKVRRLCCEGQTRVTLGVKNRPPHDSSRSGVGGRHGRLLDASENEGLIGGAQAAGQRLLGIYFRSPGIG